MQGHDLSLLLSGLLLFCHFISPWRVRSIAVMAKHAIDGDLATFRIDLIHEAMLESYSSGKHSGQISD